jgi:hypothetical protein
MPRKMLVRDKRFIEMYVLEGATEDKIRVAEKRARVRAGTGKRLLKRKTVQDELRRRLQIVKDEQEQQKLVGDAVAAKTATLQAENAELKQKLGAITSMPDMRVVGHTVELEHHLMRIVRLDPEKFAPIKLAAIKTGFVVAGIMEDGRGRLVTPPDDNPSKSVPGIYSSVFDRMRLGNGEKVLDAEVVPAQAKPDEAEVFDLIPQPPAPAVSVKLPPEGESLIPPPKQAQGNARVIQIEVG